MNFQLPDNSKTGSSYQIEKGNPLMAKDLTLFEYGSGYSTQFYASLVGLVV